MIDTAQLLFYIILIALTIVSVMVGVQLFLLIADLRKTIERVNKSLDKVTTIVDSVERPIMSLSSIFPALLGFLSVINRFKKKGDQQCQTADQQKDL